MQLDPKDYGLPSRINLVNLAENSIAILVDRKSRIIMADGKKLLHKVEQIRKINAALTVSIVTTAPVCSKTRAFLQAAGVVIQEVETISTAEKS